MAASKVVMVTGANSGIGYEAVKALMQSSNPYRILLGSRSAEKGRTAAESVRKEVPNSPSTVELLDLDLTSDQSIEKAAEHVKATSGHLDILVNNAGTSI
jgi:NAD(P)-dependent dehydrogenase (short-subunit alcohol dehydrogenase family)